MEGYIRVYDRARYLILFESEKYDYICNKIRYLTSVKSGNIILAIILQISKLVHMMLYL